MSEADAPVHVEGVRHGGTLVMVRADETQAGRSNAVLDGCTLTCSSMTGTGPLGRKEDCMTSINRFVSFAAAAAFFGLSGCTAYDRAAGTNTSGVYPSQSNGTPINPPGTAATRALDRAAGTDISGAYPDQRNGTPVNPPGTAATRAYDRATGSDVSGAYPQNQRPTARPY